MPKSLYEIAEASYEALMPREQLKLSQARAIWHKLDEETPSSLRARDQGQNYRLTWREWWQQRWKCDYNAYVEEMSRRKDATDPGVSRD